MEQKKTLKDCMYDLFDDVPAYKMKDVPVVREVDFREMPWPGVHKNVYYWVVLENGYAVGMNENPSRGLSFPIVKIK